MAVHREVHRARPTRTLTLDQRVDSAISSRAEAANQPVSRWVESVLVSWLRENPIELTDLKNL